MLFLGGAGSLSLGFEANPAGILFGGKLAASYS